MISLPHGRHHRVDRHTRGSPSPRRPGRSGSTARRSPCPTASRWSCAAGPPLVDRPITADFDEQAGSTSPSPPARTTRCKQQLEEKPHRIVRLEDADGDGVFDRRTVFADRHDVSRRGAVARRLALRLGPSPDLEADRRRRRRRRRPSRGLVRRQDPHRLRQRPARPVSRPRRHDLLVQGGLRRADLRPPGWRTVRHPRVPHLPLAARPQRPHRAGDDRRHGQPGGRRLHPRRRADLHDHLPPAARRRPARRPDPRRSTAASTARSTTSSSTGHKWTDPEVMPVLVHLGPAAACGLDRYESQSFGTGLPRQPLRLLLQHAKGHAARPGAGRSDLHDHGCRLPRLRQPRLPPDRRDRGRRRQPARGRHRRLVQALLPDLADPEGGRAGGDLPRPSRGGAEGRGTPRAGPELGRPERRRPGGPARRSPPRGSEAGHCVACQPG